ncbi:MAG: 2'-5' RNA ligase family protein [Chloroflexota bacterium]
MPKFAVYYVPPANSDLYRRGSEVIGYDVRAGALLPAENATRAALPEFDKAWVARPQTYGFHITTGYSLYFDGTNLDQIEAEMAHACGSFSASTVFELTPADEFIPFWHDEAVMLHYRPNAALLMLHTLLVARVNPLGTGSNITRERAQGDPVLARRIEKYHSPYVFDGWDPHFTLMMSYDGTQRAALRAALAGLFPAQPERVQSICLLVREDDETHYRLHREFMLA